MGDTANMTALREKVKAAVRGNNTGFLVEDMVLTDAGADAAIRAVLTDKIINSYLNHNTHCPLALYGEPAVCGCGLDNLRAALAAMGEKK